MQVGPHQGRPQRHLGKGAAQAAARATAATIGIIAATDLAPR
jgi:hypothetical protein